MTLLPSHPAVKVDYTPPPPHLSPLPSRQPTAPWPIHPCCTFAGSLLTLQGEGAYDAAVHCAAISAARRAAAATGSGGSNSNRSSGGGGGSGSSTAGADSGGANPPATAAGSGTAPVAPPAVHTVGEERVDHPAGAVEDGSGRNGTHAAGVEGEGSGGGGDNNSNWMARFARGLGCFCGRLRSAFGDMLQHRP